MSSSSSFWASVQSKKCFTARVCHTRVAIADVGDEELDEPPAGALTARKDGRGQGADTGPDQPRWRRDLVGQDNWQFVRHTDFRLFCHKMEALASKVGRRGAVVLPAKLRRRLGIEEGSFVVAEEREDGILIRPATVLPVEVYTPERRAEFLLNNAMDIEDYQRARDEVNRMGLDPDRIKHHKPQPAAKPRNAARRRE